MKNKINIILKVVQIIMALLLFNFAVYSQQMISSSTSKSVICNNADYNFSIVQGSLNNNCYFDIGFSPIWSYIPPMLCDVNQLPHGLYVEFTGATIISTSTTNSWLNLATRTPTAVSGSNFVYWNKKPLGTCSNPTNAIPSNPLITVRIWVTPASNTITVTVRNLIGPSWTIPHWPPPAIPTNSIGWAAPNQPYSLFWDCGMTQTFQPHPPLTFNIGPDGEVCINTLLNLSITPPPPVGSSVEWYYSTHNPCPSTNPPTGWEIPPYQGITFNAGYATASNYCFIAVIRTGCFTYYSNLRKITVCGGPPSATILPTPSNLIDIENNHEWHACQSWQGVLSLNPIPLPCFTTINWQRRWKYFNGTNWGPWTSWSSSLGTSTSLNTGLLTSDNQCAKMIEYRASMVNVCGTGESRFIIVIDKTPDSGSITTLTGQQCDIGIGTIYAPIVCEETRLLYKPGCGKPDHWESREETTPCSGNYGPWTIIPGSYGTNQWWTNPYPLTITTQYRVWVVNGACSNNQPPSNGVYSGIITVTVIPDPIVSILANTNLICPGSTPLLTATANLPSSCIGNVPVSYQWYKNGNIIPGATSSTYSATGPGNYYVIFSSIKCNKSAISNVIPICKPLAVISGDCCICPPTLTTPAETITLTANLVNMDPCIGTCSPVYLWSTGATTQAISVNQQGTYSVTVTCGSCIQTASFAVNYCPPHHP